MDVDENHTSCKPSKSPDPSISSDRERFLDEEMPSMEDHLANRDASEDWKGTPLRELRQVFGQWGPTPLPEVQVSSHHTVLFKVSIIPTQLPEPYVATPCDRWDQDHVRMPHSSESLYPVQETEDEKGLRLRWELVQESLLSSILNSHQLESAILSYNSRYNEKWNFVALHSFFNHVLDEAETDHFFRHVLPSMVTLALQLSELVTAPIPLLKKHKNRSISISQLQVASLLANAFFCTFPRRNSTKRGSEYASYPDINFNRLFQCGDGEDDHSIVAEKLKCIVCYFRRVCSTAPRGVLTFSRRYMQPRSLPDWENSKSYLPKLYISSKGYIEDEGSGMLQVDFANKFVGGGVLGWGCVQEEIRFLICPELLISRLFTECLDSTEALLIVGCERFSRYSGYGSSFKWVGEYHDKTPLDSMGRRHCSVVAMDALYFSNPANQFSIPNLLREVNKAYVGFYEPDNPGFPLTAVATGNWGCGAFRGDANLKAILQLMAAAKAGRPLAYFTFGDNSLRDHIHRMYRYLMENRVTIGHLWTLLCQYSKQMSSNSSLPDLYTFLYSAVLDPVLPKEIPSSTSSSVPLQPSFKGFVPKKPFKPKVNTQEKIYSRTSGTSNSSNSAGYKMPSEDVDSYIEEFDSDAEEDERLKNETLLKNEPIQKQTQKRQITDKSDQIAIQIEGRQRDCSQREQPAPKSASKSMSCLSLIEESLKTCPSKTIRSQAADLCSSKRSQVELPAPIRDGLSEKRPSALSLMEEGLKTCSSKTEERQPTSLGNEEIMTSIPIRPTSSSNKKQASALSLLEDSLKTCPSKKMENQLTNLHSEGNHVDTKTSAPRSSRIENAPSVTSQYFKSSAQWGHSSNSANKPQISNTPMEVVCTNAEDFSTPTENDPSTPGNVQDPPVRSSGTKRKISDYFSPK